MFRYRNSRTRQVVERRKRDRRLDGLDVWELLDPAPAGDAGPRPEPVGEPAEPAVSDPAPAGDQPGPDPTPELPARGASRAAWAEYAVDVARLDQTEVSGMTKAQLIDRLG